MAHSHRYRQRQRIISIHRSIKRAYTNAGLIRYEALDQKKLAIAAKTHRLMNHMLEAEKLAAELSKPLTGYPLNMLIGAEKWQKSGR